MVAPTDKRLFYVVVGASIARPLLYSYRQFFRLSAVIQYADAVEWQSRRE